MFDRARRTYVDEIMPAGVCSCGASLPAVLEGRTEDLRSGKSTFAILDGPSLHINGRRVCTACWNAEAERRGSK